MPQSVYLRRFVSQGPWHSLAVARKPSGQAALLTAGALGKQPCSLPRGSRSGLGVQSGALSSLSWLGAPDGHQHFLLLFGLLNSRH